MYDINVKISVKQIPGVTVYLSLLVMVSCRDEFTGGKYYKTGEDLTEVPNDIPNEAAEVYISGNKFTSIPDYSFSSLKQCVILDLSANLIGWYNNGFNIQPFSGLEALKKLWLSQNPIQRMDPHIFAGLTQLEELKLDNNRLRTIHGKVFKELINLKTLDVDHNGLNEHDIVHGMFTGLESLQQLFINHNEIQTIQAGAFLGLNQLKNLELGFNGLDKLRAETFAGLNALERLSLVGNGLTTLDYINFAGIPRPLELLVSHNPLRCNSDLCWLKYEEQKRTITWAGGISPNCDGDRAWIEVTWNCSGL